MQTDTPPVEALAALLISAHAAKVPLADVAPSAAITTSDEAYAVQARVSQKVGVPIGWKIGRKPGRPLTRGPLYRELMLPSGIDIPDATFHTWIVESELMFRLSRDLPPRATPYERSEVLAAVGGVMPAFEIVDSRYAAYPDIDPLLGLADGLSHGAMVLGAEIPLPPDADFTQAHVVFSVDGAVRIDQRGGNPAGDILDLLVVTANWGIPLRAGDYITTGSYTGMPVLPMGATAKAIFAGIGHVTVTRDLVRG